MAKKALKVKGHLGAVPQAYELNTFINLVNFAAVVYVNSLGRKASRLSVNGALLLHAENSSRIGHAISVTFDGPIVMLFIRI